MRGSEGEVGSEWDTMAMGAVIMLKEGNEGWIRGHEKWY